MALIEFEIAATNTNGSDNKIFAVTVGASDVRKVVLTFVRDQSLIVGESLSVDVNNTLTNNDEGVSYSCYYDSLADETVNEQLSCDLLPGTPAQKFNPLTGAFIWTPTITQNNDLEIKIKGAKKGDADSQIFAISLATQRFGEVGTQFILHLKKWVFLSEML